MFPSLAFPFRVSFKDFFIFNILIEKNYLQNVMTFCGVIPDSAFAIHSD